MSVVSSGNNFQNITACVRLHVRMYSLTTPTGMQITNVNYAMQCFRSYYSCSMQVMAMEDLHAMLVMISKEVS